MWLIHTFKNIFLINLFKDNKRKYTAAPFPVKSLFELVYDPPSGVNEKAYNSSAIQIKFFIDRRNCFNLLIYILTKKKFNYK